jgi:hypothetical protein
MDFSATNATVSTMLDWFLSGGSGTAFAECNENITYFMLISVFKMLAGVQCEHLPELKKLALSCDASILHDMSDDVGRIAKKLVKNWWTNHGLSYCM